MSEKVPVVRIGMVTGRKEIVFSGTAPLVWEDDHGEEIGRSVESKEFRVTLAQSRPAETLWYLRLSIHTDLAEAEQEARDRGGNDVGTTVRTMGLTLPVGEFTVDNREHWVLAGPFASEEEASAAQPRFGAPWESTVVRMPQRPASGILQLEGRQIAGVLRIRPLTAEGRVLLNDVRVGIGFHWEHLERQAYRGLLEIGVGTDGRLQAVNELPIEEYLASVNSSEMSPDCPVDLLRAQTVAARSTLLATMGKHHYAETFHLCADDHCQCYHGSGAEQETSWQGVRDTWGEVLLYAGRVCDARYSKICGGAMEDYRYVWDDRAVPYLVSGTDGPEPLALPLDDEEKARAYIDASPDVYCNTVLHPLPEGQSQSRDLFRWEVTYRREELEKIISEKSGRQIGTLQEIRPLQRGPSGRLVAIEVVGSRDRFRVGKELAIRRLLSPSHLYSSCFYVEPIVAADGRVSHFTFRGAGWGHGVGLCQIGATVMASSGFSYEHILLHYYKGAELRRIYTR